MGPRRFEANPRAVEGIQNSLRGQERTSGKLARIGDKVYLEARALAPALRVIPALGPVMATAMIAAGRAQAVVLAGFRRENLGGFRGLKDTFTATGALVHNIGMMFRTPPRMWRSRLAEPIMINLKEIFTGIFGLFKAILSIIPTLLLIGGGVIAILAFSRMFRSLLGHAFGILSAVLDILLMPFLPLFMFVIDKLTGLLGWASRSAQWLEGTLLPWFANTAFPFLQAIPEKLVALYNWFKDSALWETLKTLDWIGLFSNVAKIALAIVDFLANVIPPVIDTVAGVVDEIGVGGTIATLLTGILGWFTGGKIVAGLGTAIGGITAFFLPILVALSAGITAFGISFATAHWDEMTLWNKIVFVFTGLPGLIISTLGKILGLQAGMPNVPRTMPVIVHPGEAIVPAAVRPYLGMSINQTFILGTPGMSGGVEQRMSTELDAVLRKIFPY